MHGFLHNENPAVHSRSDTYNTLEAGKYVGIVSNEYIIIAMAISSIGKATIREIVL